MSELDTAALDDVADAYDDLRSQEASQRRLRGDGVSHVTVGPTGAAKILHALRPNSLPPWDDPIRAALRYDASRSAYLRFLHHVQDQVRHVEAEASAVGISASDVPRELGRPGSSVPKMIDEYYWVTITRGHIPPTTDEVTRWHVWAQGAGVVAPTS